jgi:type VI protein secretion system component Hcp
MAQKSKPKKEHKNLKKSKKMEEVKPLLFGSVATGKHISKAILYVRKSG